MGHVQKRMGTQLRSLKFKQNVLRGRGKLTGKEIDNLIEYDGLSLRRHFNSIEDSNLL